MRKFGVEVEFSGDRAAVLRALQAAGLSARAASYSGREYSHWQVKTDGSVPGGGEIVSPVLDFDSETDREQVSRALRAAASAGARTCEQAGVHVHVDASDLDPRQVAAVLMNFSKYEDVIYRLASSGWRRIRRGAATYARPLTDAQKAGLGRVRTEQALRRAYGAAGSQGRYHGLNLQSWVARRTLEFRVFNSTMNPERLQAYVALAVGMVHDARLGKRRSVARSYKLGTSVGLPQADQWKRYVNFYNMLRYGAGLELSDMRRITKCWHDSQSQQAVSVY